MFIPEGVTVFTSGGDGESPPEVKNGRLIPQSSIIHTIVDETFLFHQDHSLGLRMLTRFERVIQ